MTVLLTGSIIAIIAVAVAIAWAIWRPLPDDRPDTSDRPDGVASDWVHAQVWEIDPAYRGRMAVVARSVYVPHGSDLLWCHVAGYEASPDQAHRVAVAEFLQEGDGYSFQQRLNEAGFKGQVVDGRLVTSLDPLINVWVPPRVVVAIRTTIVLSELARPVVYYKFGRHPVGGLSQIVDEWARGVVLANPEQFEGLWAEAAEWEINEQEGP